MPEIQDLLQQIQELSSQERERLAAHLFEDVPLPFYPRFFIRYQIPDFPSVVRTPNVCGGSPRLIRTRIPIWVLQRMRQFGFSEAKILQSYPTLTASDLVQTWEYVAAHAAEIEKEIEENEQD